eukprot:CAMPEP_0172214006 /NCGR_PEP_ID=MMETSP1050-20130122/37918_1 /TAXON_ID=233186 /ORGANISM="Cryptomonas curvata, Strain CCAP979/52" /LENGTH=271 /DNA_ID=CAMNT_0012894921 /DNA_START=54 /DNA_END=867 /DNA_ORIENTATION=+
MSKAEEGQPETDDSFLNDALEALRADIMLLYRQIETTSATDIDEMLDSILRHFLRGREFRESMQSMNLFHLTATSDDEFEVAKQTISGLKEIRRSQQDALKQLEAENSQLKLSLARRETLLGEIRGSNLKEVIVLKEKIAQLTLQFEHSTEHGKDASGERRIVSKLQSEINQLRKENDFYRAQEQEIRGEVESMKIEAKLAALTADAEQEPKPRSPPSTKEPDSALCNKQARDTHTDEFPQHVLHCDPDTSAQPPPAPATAQASTQTDLED